MLKYFKLSPIIKLIFLLIFFGIEYIKSTKRSNFNLNFLDNFIDFDIDIKFPWYESVLFYTAFYSFFIIIILSLIISFKPCFKYTLFIYKKLPAQILYSIEIVSCLAFFYFSINKLIDAFARDKDYGIIGNFLESVIKSDKETMRFYDKVEALNLFLLFFASFIFLLTFWVVRKNNIQKCSIH